MQAALAPSRPQHAMLDRSLWHVRRLSSLKWAATGIVLAIYAGLLAFLVPRHEPWADEAQAWQMAGHVSFYQLFHIYIHYEISPGLWQAFLWLLVRIHVSYTGLHWIAAAIAFGAMFLLIAGAPFPFWLRLMLPFTFYFGFQYAVVARNYVLWAPILFGLAWLWPRRKEHPVAVAVLTGLLANVAAHGLAVALGLAIVLVIEWWSITDRKEAQSPDWIMAALVLVALLGFSAWCLKPAPDADWLLASKTFLSNPDRSTMAMSLLRRKTVEPPRPPLLRIALDLSLRFEHALWKSLTPHEPIGVIAWIALVWRWVREGCLRYGLPILLLAAFCTVTRFNVYHGGLIWITFLFLWWVTWPANSGFLQAVILCMVLLCTASQVMGFIRAYRYDVAAPYSPDRDGAVVLASYLSSGKKVDVAVAARSGVPQHGEFFAVGLEPYFDAEPLHNMRARFWIWRDDSDMRGQYVRDIENRSVVVLVEETPDDSRFPAEEASLNSSGYRRSATVCGSVYYPWEVGRSLCHAFYEPR